MKIPNESVAASIAKREIGETPTAIRRFSNGVHRYVYEVEFARRASVVVRLTRSSERLAMQGASVLSASLRPHGVPLHYGFLTGLNVGARPDVQWKRAFVHRL
jgi:hypothetical protein